MSAKEDYWSSTEGIEVRLEDLAHEFTFKVYNGALKGYFKDGGIKKLKWITSQININKGTSCPICLGRNGKIYWASQFLPKQPVHNKCDCYWDIAIVI